MKQLTLSHPIFPITFYVLLLLICALIYQTYSYWGGNFPYCMHFSLDTITLRGRISEDHLDDPADEKKAADEHKEFTSKANRAVILAASDIEAIAGLVIVVVWFGWSLTTLGKKDNAH